MKKEFSIYLLISHNGSYHLLNSYENKDEAENHLNKLKNDIDGLKVVKIKNPILSIKEKTFEKFWMKQQPIER